MYVIKFRVNFFVGGILLIVRNIGYSEIFEDWNNGVLFVLNSMFIGLCLIF